MTTSEKLATMKAIENRNDERISKLKAPKLKYYVYTYRDGAGGGRRYILAASEPEAKKQLRQFLNQYHPFRKYRIDLENVMTI